MLNFSRFGRRQWILMCCAAVTLAFVGCGGGATDGTPANTANVTVSGASN